MITVNILLILGIIMVLPISVLVLGAIGEILDFIWNKIFTLSFIKFVESYPGTISVASIIGILFIFIGVGFEIAENRPKNIEVGPVTTNSVF